jgi:4'-phosphopantetheinyl transferase
MIRWLVQTVADHPDLSALRPPKALLTAAEAAHYATYLSPRRRRDWLLGRWTAKQVVQQHIATTDGFTPALDAFSIEYDDHGAPTITSQHPALRGACGAGCVPLALSISHSHGYALCAVAANPTGEVRLGVDIELVEPRPAGFAQEFFTPAEKATLEVAPPDLRDLLTTAMWSVKEAILKATHLGLSTDPRRIACGMHPVRPRHWTPLRVSLDPSLHEHAGSQGALRVWWRVLDNRLRPGTSFVLTLAAYGAIM